MGDYPPVLAMAELVNILGLSRSRVVQLLETDEFPDQIATLTVGRIWATKDIEAYARKTGRQLHSIATG